jgi:hypothetical protein
MDMKVVRAASVAFFSRGMIDTAAASLPTHLAKTRLKPHVPGHRGALVIR